MNRLDDVAREFIRLLDKLEIPYAVMGGLAVRLHAIPRATYDVDLLVALTPDKLAALQRAAEKLGFSAPESKATGWIDRFNQMAVAKFQWSVESQLIDVDLFLVESPFHESILSRRVRHALEDLEGWYVSPEDLILLKLIAYRPKDRSDIADIVFIQPTLDLEYLRTWANRIGVESKLKELLDQGAPN